MHQIILSALHAENDSTASHPHNIYLTNAKLLPTPLTCHRGNDSLTHTLDLNHPPLSYEFAKCVFKNNEQKVGMIVDNHEQIIISWTTLNLPPPPLTKPG